MPDKNVADSLARLPGITTSAAGANEGGFDENDRVSMRGTNPSLTQTLINGHNVAAGDWFVLDQVQTVGRSVSYTLLPSEIVSKVVVEKSSSASLVEGGVAGSVDIITRKPLDFGKQFTLEASVGAVYADLPSKTDGQYSALANFKNDANNFGVMLQLFSETRDLRRDGVEILGYDTIAPGSAVATAHPDLSNVQYPTEIGAAFFTQRRQRNGGMADIEFKPTDELTLDLSAFSSKLTASNYNRNYLMWSTHFVNFGAGQSPDPGYTVQNNTLTSANFTGVPGTFYGVYDQISRPDETATANFVNLDTTWNASGNLSFLAQIGYSWGDGKTPHQDVSETQPGLGSGAAYQLNGLGSAPNFNLGNTVNNTPTPGGVPVTFGWIFGAADIDIRDTEKWAKIDSDYKIDDGAWKDLKFGVRYQAHDRTSPTGVAQGPLNTSTSAYPTTFSNYPSNFNTFGGNIPTDIWYWTPAQLAAYNSPANVNRDPITREYYQYLFAVYEKDAAAFVQADFKGENWAANFGIRYVNTKEDAISYTQVDASTPGAVLTSAFGPFAGLEGKHTYNDVLPSANFKWDLTRIGGALRGRRDHDTPRLLRAGRIHQPHAAGSRRQCRRRFGRQPGFETDSLDQLRRRPRVVFRTAFAAVGDGFLHGFAQLRGIWLGNQNLQHLRFHLSDRLPDRVQLDGSGQRQRPGVRHGDRLSTGVHRQHRLYQQLHLCGRQADRKCAAQSGRIPRR